MPPRFLCNQLCSLKGKFRVTTKYVNLKVWSLLITAEYLSLFDRYAFPENLLDTQSVKDKTSTTDCPTDLLGQFSFNLGMGDTC